VDLADDSENAPDRTGAGEEGKTNAASRGGKGRGGQGNDAKSGTGGSGAPNTTRRALRRKMDFTEQ